MNKKSGAKISKKKIKNNESLVQNINKMHYEYILLMKLKNLPNEIIDIIMKNIINNNKNLKLDFTTNYPKKIIKQNKSKIVEHSIRTFLNNIEKEANLYIKKEKIIQLFNYMINNSYFMNKKSNFSLSRVVKLKIKEFIIELKNSNKNLDIKLINKLNESNQKIFGLKKINLCIKCNNNVSSLKYNYNLCFNHLCEKFSF